MKWTFADRFEFRVVDSLDPWDIDNKLRKVFAEEFQGTDAKKLTSDSENQQVAKFRERMKTKFCLRIGVFEKNELIGWHIGWQDGNNDYAMMSSAVFPDYRRFGIYSELMRAVFEITKNEGFQRITSTHLVSNNAVIIAKLKAGFKIMGVEMMEAYGMMVRLVYYHHDLKNDLFDFRVGMKGTTGAVSDYLFADRYHIQTM